MPELDKLFLPRAVAVIGASEDATKIGGRVMKTLASQPYSGRIYPVNPRSESILGMKVYQRIDALPDDVDLALIAIPAKAVPACVQECARVGIPAVLIFSSGFSEGGEEGVKLQRELAEIAQSTGIKIAGPNAEGFYSSENDLAATFSPAVNLPKLSSGSHGKIDILSQSGGLGFSFFKKGHSAGLEFGKVITVGNQVDLEISDYLDYLIDQEQTRLVMMYVESFKNPKRFCEIAERAGSFGKPLVMVKVGASQAGRRAAESHTGALASSDQVVDAVLSRHGVIRVDDQDRLIDISAALVHQPLPRGNRVAIITTSGGTAVWTADACETAGLVVPEIDGLRQSKIAAFIPSYGSTTNPVDITAQSRDGLTSTLQVLLDSDDIDCFIVAANFASTHRLKEEGERLATVIKSSNKPILLYSYADPSEESKEMLRGMGLYCHRSLQGCVAALKALFQYHIYQQSRSTRAAESHGKLEVPNKALRLLDGDHGRVLCEYEAKELLRTFDIRIEEEIVAKSASEAALHAKRMGFPVVLKLQSPDISHKSDANAIALGVNSEVDVFRAYHDVIENGLAYCQGAEIRGVLVQKMAPLGLEIIAGIKNDPEFGHMIVVGLGGIYVEVLKDVSIAPAPLTRQSAHDMLSRLKAYPLLEGVRGEPRKDIDALVDFLVKLSHMAVALENHIDEFDVNPVFVYEQGKGIAVVDALGVRTESVRSRYAPMPATQRVVGA